MEKVKTLISRGTHIPIREAIAEINNWYQGWASYFKMTQYPAQLKAIEAHIRRGLRARIIRQQKKKRNLSTLLQRKGINKKKAAKTVYSNRRPWNLSHTRVIEKALSIESFVKNGQAIISRNSLAHWFGIER